LDHSGSIDHDELITLLNKVGFGQDPEEVEAIVNSVDKDGSGFFLFFVAYTNILLLFLL
jgi:Ca2+-binding EF-hand superfamily protein